MLPPLDDRTGGFMVEREMWTAREVSQYLGLNEKVVYRFIRERGLPATKITGKWLFSKTLVDEWLQDNIERGKRYKGKPVGNFTLLACSDEPLLNAALSECQKDSISIDSLFFCANVGSSAALQMLSSRQVQAASAHLLDPQTGEYNIPYLKSVIDDVVVVSFVQRTQGILMPRRSGERIEGLRDIVRKRIPLLTRQPSSGTYKLLQCLIEKEGVRSGDLKLITGAAGNHFEVARRVQSGEAPAGFSIEAVARIFGLRFIPLHKERYDLIFFKDEIRKEPVKRILSFINSTEFETLSSRFGGYDCKLTGKLVA
jgi:excisionase family DNA binding protein